MKITRTLAVRLLVLAVVAVPGGSGLASAQPAPLPPPPPPACPECCPPSTCGDSCPSYPFERTDCWTTTYGPAQANVIVGKSAVLSPNMLYCPSGAYALCFFSGPSTATGNPGFDNPALPCVLEGDGDVANCTCEAFKTGPYYVDVNAIINLGVYYQTTSLEQCGPDGSGCKNMRDCDANGRGERCPDRIAPVCAYVENQDPNDPTVSLVPGADLISTFSFAMSSTGAYTLASVPCDALYAGCMTAPCKFPAGVVRSALADGGRVLVQCACPTYDGTFQVGQATDQCTPKPSDGKTYVWSAANTVSGGS